MPPSSMDLSQQKAVRLAEQLADQHVVIESDAMAAVNAINQPGDSVHWEIDAIVEDLKSMLAQLQSHVLLVE
ncbi:hypothetical protein NC651_040603 [Populus alba x Populus x berolinensis]|nr:hypothetical protein NC651_040603 [Populus alba x Populus x berolinensis]